MITVVWVVTVAYGIILIILFNVLEHKNSRRLGHVAFIAVAIAGFITLLTTNCFVFVEARKQLKAIEKTSVVPNNKSNRKIEFRKKEFRLVRINIGLILCFFLFWINAVIVKFKLLVYADENELHLHLEYVVAAVYLVHLYYLCNPLWHVTLNHDVKQEVKLFFKQKIVE